MKLIMEKFADVHIFSTFFYTKLVCGGYESVCSWYNKIDMFGKRLLMFPIHLDASSHWCLAAANIVDKQISYFDSLQNDNFACLRNLETYLIQAQQLQAKGDSVNWHSIICKDIPVQHNSFDCGVFTCMYARYLAEDKVFNFNQGDVPIIRKKIALELIHKALLYN